MVSIVFMEAAGKGHACIFCLVHCPFTMTDSSSRSLQGRNKNAEQLERMIEGLRAPQWRMTKSSQCPSHRLCQPPTEETGAWPQNSPQTYGSTLTSFM